MLAVFDKSVAKSPEGLQSPHSDSVSALKDGFIAEHFSSVHPGSVTVNLGSSGLLAYSLHRQNPLLPRLFAVVDDIFCLFQGHLENVANLKQQYGLNKTATEVIIIIEAYRTLRDRGPYPAAQVVRDFQGKFAFILYDSGSKTAFVAADADGSVPFVWGTDADGNLIFSDETEIVTKSCGKSSAPFPKVRMGRIRKWRVVRPRNSSVFCLGYWKHHNNNNTHFLPPFLVQFYQLVSKLRSRSVGIVNGDEGKHENGDTHGSHGEGYRGES
ncbi:Stem-specific protein TSJT1 [Glycine soja]|uniref:Stem-specific protein TSJT1 n=1 Tax=Glycine soja TaxID=3848 RepID=A0A445F5J3_GLYSO|nr:Stem-specific protein TSJT1 [Glycine soja]